MDPISIAGAVIAALTPYFSKAAGKFVEAAGESAWDKTAQLYQLVKSRLASSPEAATQLANLACAPDSVVHQTAATQALGQTLAHDAAFLRAVSALLQAAGTHSDAHFHNQFGQVGTVNQIGSVQTLNIGGKT